MIVVPRIENNYSWINVLTSVLCSVMTFLFGKSLSEHKGALAGDPDSEQWGGDGRLNMNVVHDFFLLYFKVMYCQKPTKKLYIQPDTYGNKWFCTKKYVLSWSLQCAPHRLSLHDHCLHRSGYLNIYTMLFNCVHRWILDLKMSFTIGFPNKMVVWCLFNIACASLWGWWCTCKSYSHRIMRWFSTHYVCVCRGGLTWE